MKVAKVWLNKYESGKLLGFADITFSLTDGGDGCFTVRGWKIFKDDNGGITVATPSKKDEKDGKYYPLVQILDENTDGQALLAHVKEAVAMKFNNMGAKKHENQNSGVGGGIEEGDIPF